MNDKESGHVDNPFPRKSRKSRLECTVTGSLEELTPTGELEHDQWNKETKKHESEPTHEEEQPGQRERVQRLQYPVEQVDSQGSRTVGLRYSTRGHPTHLLSGTLPVGVRRHPPTHHVTRGLMFLRVLGEGRRIRVETETETPRRGGNGESGSPRRRRDVRTGPRTAIPGPRGNEDARGTRTEGRRTGKRVDERRTHRGPVP